MSFQIKIWVSSFIPRTGRDSGLLQVGTGSAVTHQPSYLWLALPMPGGCLCGSRGHLNQIRIMVFLSCFSDSSFYTTCHGCSFWYWITGAASVLNIPHSLPLRTHLTTASVTLPATQHYKITPHWGWKGIEIRQFNLLNL